MGQECGQEAQWENPNSKRSQDAGGSLLFSAAAQETHKGPDPDEGKVRRSYQSPREENQYDTWVTGLG